jgi:hypothetical protein
MTRSSFAPLLSVILTVACSDRSLADVTTPSGETGANESHPGEVFATCRSAQDCDSDLSCFHPAGEPGYCTVPCAADQQCYALDPSLADLACVYLQPANASICAIYCDEGSCPLNMRCESVDLGSSSARLCF